MSLKLQRCFLIPLLACVVLSPSLSLATPKLECTELLIGPYQGDDLPHSYRLIDYRLLEFFKEGEVALTFDDGPDPVLTLKIADILDKYGVTGHFFQIGKNAEKYPEISRELIARGHVVGSHSWDHPSFSNLDFESGLKNIVDGHAAVMRATEGKASAFFRFPYGNESHDWDKHFQSSKILALYWNANPGDYNDISVETLLDNAKRSVKFSDGRKRRGVMLFHDTQQKTAEMLERFLQYLADEGYKLVRLKYEPANDWKRNGKEN